MKQPQYKDAIAVAEALQPDYPVCCIAPATLRDAARNFLDHFDGKVLYAVKCNPHPWVMQALYEAGIRHFDVASLTEIAAAHELFPDATLYYMNPAKSRSMMTDAHQRYGVRHYVIDHEHELDKILEVSGGDALTVFVRFKNPKSHALYNLDSKFGATPAQAVRLLRAVQQHGLHCGLAFHVGSQCTVADAFGAALAVAGQIIEQSAVTLRYLDVGGGFPAYYPGARTPPLTAFFDAIKTGVAALAPGPECTLLCEPGRALVTDGCSLLTRVVLRKDDALYINDGIYGCLSEPALSQFKLPVRLIRMHGEPAHKTRPFTIYGPTCDALDVQPLPFHLPEDVREGDWIEIGKMGAYGTAVATHFNGFTTDHFVQVEQVWNCGGHGD